MHVTNQEILHPVAFHSVCVELLYQARKQTIQQHAAHEYLLYVLEDPMNAARTLAYNLDIGHNRHQHRSETRRNERWIKIFIEGVGEFWTVRRIMDCNSLMALHINLDLDCRLAVIFHYQLGARLASLNRGPIRIADVQWRFLSDTETLETEDVLNDVFA